MELFEAIEKRRDTRHFIPNEEVPEDILEKCMEAAYHGPSVGLTAPARYIFVRDVEVRTKIHELFVAENDKAAEGIVDDERRAAYKSLKLAGILDAPLGIVIFADYSTLKNHTIGVVASKEALDWSVCCSIQNLWLALTSYGYGMGWVSIINFEKLKELIDVPDCYKPLGYFCVGKPATDYNNMPMLKLQGWSNE